jgi:AcrR family transcriptional regulator
MQTRKDTLIRQQEIVSAARKLIVKYGSEHVTIKKMADEIGVSEGAIYRHFKSKRDILSFMVDDIEQTMIGDIEKHCSDKLKSLEVLEKIMIEHISAVEQRRGVGFQVIAEIISLGDKKLNKKVYEVIKKYNSRITDILRDGVKEGVIRSDLDMDATAQMFFSMTQGLVNLWALSMYSFNLVTEFKSTWKIFLMAVGSPQYRAAGWVR